MNKQKIWEIINADKNDNKRSKYFDTFILTLILLNTLAVIISTISNIEKKYGFVLYIFEIISISIFTIEYLLRIFFCTQDKKYKNPILGRIKFALTPMALIDLISIIPFYLPFFSYDLRFIRIFRIFRIIRVLKIERYISTGRLIKKVFQKKKSELALVGVIFSITILISSFLIFYSENPAQPKIFTTFFKSISWSIASITNLASEGFPITTIGKFTSSILSIFGLLIIALITSILSSGFTQVLISRKSRKKIKCPHCGKEI